MKINSSISKLSFQGLKNILSSNKHITINIDDNKKDLQCILQCNLNDSLIDEIEILLELESE